MAARNVPNGGGDDLELIADEAVPRPAPRSVRSAMFDGRADDDDADTGEPLVLPRLPVYGPPPAGPNPYIPPPARPPVQLGHLPGRAVRVGDTMVGHGALAGPSRGDDDGAESSNLDFGGAAAAVPVPQQPVAWGPENHAPRSGPQSSAPVPSAVVPGRSPFAPPPPGGLLFAQPLPEEVIEDYHAQRPSGFGRARNYLLALAAAGLITGLVYRDRILNVLAENQPAAAGSAVAGGPAGAEQQQQPLGPALGRPGPAKSVLLSGCGVQVRPINGGTLFFSCGVGHPVVKDAPDAAQWEAYREGTQRRLKAVYRVVMTDGANVKRPLNCPVDVPRPTDQQRRTGAQLSEGPLVCTEVEK